MTHLLKIWPEYFERMIDGAKNFEVRRNDRDFQVGDYLCLQEWRPESEAFSGRVLTRKVIYSLHGHDSDVGICAGYVVMGLEAVA